MMKTCAKIHKKIGKNANPWEGGYLKNPHGFIGGSAKNHVCPQGGGGIKNGQKPVHMVYE